MKRTCQLLSLVAAIFGSAMSLSAQSTFGVTAGVNSSNVKISALESGDPSPKALIGFAVGVTMVRPLNAALDFAPELLISQKGTKFAASEEDVDVELKLKMVWLDVPVLFRYGFGAREANTTRFFVTAGPTVSLRLSCKAEASLDSEELDFSLSQDCDDDSFPVKSTDFGLLGGIGLTKGRFFGSVRYTLGVTNIADAESMGNESVKTRLLSFMAGINF
jgi:hypothetical protein